MLSNDFFKNLLDEMINLKGYFIIYFVLLSAFIISQEFFYNINFKGILFETFLLFLLGCLLLLFITKKDLPIHKVAFLIILIFGLCCVFITPTVLVPDEYEHFLRSELTSKGEFFPNYVTTPNTNKTGYESKGYETIYSLVSLSKDAGKSGESISLMSDVDKGTVFQMDWDDKPINYESGYVDSVFAQNPFYGYIPQAIGIDIAKGLCLNNIWMLWFGRLCNLLFYVLICSYAVKKAPIYKTALLVTACLPITIFEAASLSIDASVNALLILSISYFLYLYKKEAKTITWKDLSIFSIILLLSSLTKLTYLALALLIFLIPKDKFKSINTRYLSGCYFLIVSLITIIWSRYATRALLNSWRYIHNLNCNVNSHIQLIYILTNPYKYLTMLLNLDTFKGIVKTFFSFCVIPDYSVLFMLIFIIVFIIFCLSYPSKNKIKKNTKISLLIISLLVYFGTLTVQYLTYSPVYSTVSLGVQARYFIPLIAFAPMIFSINNTDYYNYKKTGWIRLVYILIVAFLSILLLTLLTNFYNF